ncbi:hypothetical protein PAAG_08345 [Paracoccidioides lutzii Pb01]|uniref:Uncharacterized protein n=1 Tax=Paracoccidioides lutzii (strain ATCC MYA-826 / Pb01) TaxID=502779 RepID=C1HC54_PARBA|nr:hypothetical protein PAAG_08345 [Paracoccidioides lutzii Pb01]EEH38618.2 hypothetical protein PAAG_08345 [Paracoccidioides lutzii Pb01]
MALPYIVSDPAFLPHTFSNFKGKSAETSNKIANITLPLYNVVVATRYFCGTKTAQVTVEYLWMVTAKHPSISIGQKRFGFNDNRLGWVTTIAPLSKTSRLRSTAKSSAGQPVILPGEVNKPLRWIGLNTHDSDTGLPDSPPLLSA